MLDMYRNFLKEEKRGLRMTDRQMSGRADRRAAVRAEDGANAKAQSSHLCAWPNPNP